MKKQLIILFSLFLFACSKGGDSNATGPIANDNGGNSEPTAPTIPTSCGVDLYLDSDSCVAVPVGEYSADGDTSKESCTNTDTNVATLTYTSVGGGSNNCSYTVDSCDSGYHIDSNSCISSTRTQNLTEGEANQTWDGSQWVTDDFNSCNPSYHLDGSNMCISNTRSCTIANGTGEETWGGSSWGACTVTSCDDGYADRFTNNTCVPVPEMISTPFDGIMPQRGIASTPEGVIFNGYSGPDYELYILRESTGQIELLKDINASGSSDPQLLGSNNSIAYFLANDGSTGKEVWVTDGTEAGTQLVTDVRTGTMSSFNINSYYISTSGRLYYTCYDGTNFRACSTDGTTTEISSFTLDLDASRRFESKGSKLLSRFYEKDNKVYTIGTSSGDITVYSAESDGIFDTNEYTLTNFFIGLNVPGTASRYDYRITVDSLDQYNITLFFEDGGNYYVLHAVDYGGSVDVDDIIQTTYLPMIYETNGSMFFTTNNSRIAYYDGANLVESPESSGTSIDNAVKVNNKTIIASRNSSLGREIFDITDLTTSSAIADYNSGSSDGFFFGSSITKTSNYAYYSCNNGSAKRICRTDGATIEQYVDYALDPNISLLDSSTILNGYLYGIPMENLGSSPTTIFKVKVE